MHGSKLALQSQPKQGNSDFGPPLKFHAETAVSVNKYLILASYVKGNIEKKCSKIINNLLHGYFKNDMLVNIIYGMCV